MSKKKTVGSASQDLIENAPQVLDHSPYEQMQEQLENFDKELYICLERGKKKYPGNFYIVVETKKEPLMKNVIRQYFFHRQSCPTPTYDNVVYRYHAQDEYIEFLWVLPDIKTYYMYLDNALDVPIEQRELLQCIIDDRDGTLLQICKELNGELN